MNIGIIIIFCLFVLSCENTEQKQQKPLTKSISDHNASESILQDEMNWEKVAKFGGITTVYMPPEAFSDKYLIAEILDSLRIQFPI
jgi:hypothetical protein